MIRLLKCEFYKTRRRHLLLTILSITGISLVWAFYGNYEGESGQFILENGWMNFLYQMPLLNAIFFPLLSTVAASRLADTEHKGEAIRQLSVRMEKGQIYDIKMIYGLGFVLLALLMQWGGCILFGKYMGFGGELPVNLYLLFLLFTMVPTLTVYMIQYALSMIYKNQAVAFFTGIIGTFVGLFSMFLPQIPWLRRCLPWGYYGVLQFVGLFGWTKETRYAEAYFALLEIDWLFFGLLLVSGLLCYWIGRSVFCRKEV